ncbi:unnamed protein product [Heligmosomoides polygyrus]|uniref:DUF5641 domain-containing protein n=1 Tax=Heligmosomoides polygyrus TaxID=6339 RepID=A0A183FS76_HELPZ|nr:unnamed protein product [Heligmosomoides polygyrus]
MAPTIKELNIQSPPYAKTTGYQKYQKHVRKILNRCVKCRRFNGHAFSCPSTTDLPKRRTSSLFAKRFQHYLPLHSMLKFADDDAEYLPPEEIRILKSRQEVVAGLQESCHATEKFWTICKNQYLTSLRETHKKLLANQRYSQATPKIGDVVLLCDPILPRNGWRLARIIKTKTGGDGAIREVELITSTPRKIRRLVNLITPLEINSTIRKLLQRLKTNTINTTTSDLIQHHAITFVHFLHGKNSNIALFMETETSFGEMVSALHYDRLSHPAMNQTNIPINNTPHGRLLPTPTPKPTPHKSPRMYLPPQLPPIPLPPEPPNDIQKH